MAYAECEAGVVTLLQSLTTQFPTSAQVALSSAILDAGVTNAACVFPGSIREGRSKGPAYERVWDVMLNLYTQFSDEAATLTAFKALRAAVILKIDENPNLAGVTGVNDAVIISEGDIYLSTPEPIYMAQNFRVSVFQTLRVT